MKRLYFWIVSLAFSSILNAQIVQDTPCSDFNSGSGNWAVPAASFGNILVSFASANTLDNSRYVQLKDYSGDSRYENSVDYKNLGQRFLGQCLSFDYQLVTDGDPSVSVPFHPFIVLSDGINSIMFVANVTVTEGGNWVRVTAPIALSNGGPLPSNASGSWQYGTPGMTTADFDHVMSYSTTLTISPEVTNYGEIARFDNICVVRCPNECTADFTLQASFNSTNNVADVSLTLINPNMSSTPGNPGSLYTVNWGDGSPTNTYTFPSISHTYYSGNTYTICVTETKGRETICKRCYTFCFQGRDITVTEKNQPSVLSLTKIEEIARAETKNTDIKSKVYTIVPNPAKNHVEIQTTLSKKETVSVKVIDLSGKVLLEKSETLNSGNQNIQLNTESLSQGIYIIEILSNGKKSSEKLLISK